MNAIPIHEQGTVAELPPYRALLIVDLKNFSGIQGRRHAEITAAVPDILRQAFRRCGLERIWDQRRFGDSTGDGYAVGFRARALPFLLNPFLSGLQQELAARNAERGASAPEQPMRMRASIHIGPMTDSRMGDAAEGSGDARIETHRLLDSEPVRDLLTRSGSPTLVAAIVSARAYEDAVHSGYCGEDPTLYVSVPVRVKTYQGSAFLRVPAPSGELLRHGFQTQGTEDIEADASQEPPSRAAVSTVVHEARGPMNTGTGHQFNAPHADTSTDRRGQRDGR